MSPMRECTVFPADAILDGKEYDMQSLSMEEIIPLLKDVCATGAPFRFCPKGTSMLPTIVGGKDFVEVKTPFDIKPYDVLLYRRDNGVYVLHRLVRIGKDGTYVMCGDNQVFFEKGIRPDQIIAKMTAVIKDDSVIPADDPDLVRRIRYLYMKKPIRRFFARAVRYTKKLFR